MMGTLATRGSLFCHAFSGAQGVCNFTSSLFESKYSGCCRNYSYRKKINNVVILYLAGYNMTGADRKDLNSSVLTYHRIVEAFKFSYAYRALLGDKDFLDLNEVSPSCMDTDKSL